MAKVLVVCISLLSVMVVFSQVCIGQQDQVLSDHELLSSFYQPQGSIQGCGTLVSYVMKSGSYSYQINELRLNPDKIPLPVRPKKSSTSSRSVWLYVGGSGPGNYSSIQDGIDNASDGDTIFVYNGIYQITGWVTVNKAVQVVGEDENNTILDGKNSNGTIFLVTSNDVLIQSFTLRNCVSSGFYQAIYLWVNPRLDDIVISHCIMKNNDKGIYLTGVSNLVVEFCNFHNNLAQSLLGGFESGFSVHDCVFIKNGRDVGGGWFQPGGITVSGKSNFSVHDNAFIENIGWGVYCDNERNADVFQNTFIANTDAIYLEAMSQLQIHDNHIENNSHAMTLNCCSMSVVVQENDISGNGGVLIQDCKDCVTIQHNRFVASSFGVSAGASNGTIICNNSFFATTNVSVCVQIGNGYQVSDNSFLNGRYGIYLLGLTSITVARNTISGCENGIYVKCCGNYSYPNATLIKNNNVSGNTKGIYLEWSDYNTMTENIFSNNQEAGFVINSSYNNIISKNNLVKNRHDAKLTGIMMPLVLHEHNNWVGNYWEHGRLLPKMIFGWVRMRSFPRLHFYQPKILLPCFEFDSSPASKPYDIGI